MVICVGNAPIMLQSLKENARTAFLHADIQACLSEKPALNYAQAFACDILLCENNPTRLEELRKPRYPAA